MLLRLIDVLYLLHCSCSVVSMRT